MLTTPALAILKQARPDLCIAIAVEDRFRAVFEGHPAVDEILAPEWPAVRRFRPELCLDLHGGTRAAGMTAFSGARVRAGFGHFRHGWAYNLRIPRAQETLGVERTVHTAEHLASAMFFLGAPAAEIPRASLAARRTATRPECIVHASAATPEKTWPANRFLAVAAQLRQTGIEPVFIGAAGDDLSPFRDYRIVQGAPLADVQSLMAAASLFLGNDSGPAHMAAALGLPVVVIFGASDPAIWGPWRTPAEIVTAAGGIANVAVSQVVEALARLRVHA